MKLATYILVLFLSFTVKSQSLIWSTQSDGYVNPMLVTNDQAGNMIVSGWFMNSVDFDPGPAVYTVTTTDLSAFVCKFDPAGNFLWVAAFENSASNARYGLCTDPQGNVYSIGFYNQTCDFDPGPGVFNLTAPLPPPALNLYVLKLTATGTFAWAKPVSSGTFIHACATDGAGNLLVCGNFSSTCDMDWGSPVSNLSALGSLDGFVSKLDPQGNLVFARQFGAQFMTNSLSNLSVAASGNLLAFGKLPGTVDADPGASIYPLTGTNSDCFSVGLDVNGNFINASLIQQPPSATPFFFTNDLAGNVYLTGTFTGTAVFDPGNSSATIQAMPKAGYVCKYDQNGNFTWVKCYHNAGIVPLSPTVLGNGVIYFPALISGTVDADPGPATLPLYGPWFFSLLNSNGNLLSALNPTLSGPYSADDQGNLYVSAMGVGSGMGPAKWTNNKYGFPLVGLPATNSIEKSYTVYPNPGTGVYYLKYAPDDILAQRIYDTQGNLCLERTSEFALPFDLGGNPPGIYFIHTFSRSPGPFVQKIIKE